MKRLLVLMTKRVLNIFQELSLLSLIIIGLIGLNPSIVNAESGVVLMVKGTVSINAGGVEKQAKIGLRLKEGDIIKGIDGSASILLDDGRVKVVHKGEIYTLNAGTSSSTKSPVYARLMETIRETAHQGRSPTIKGMVRGERDIVPLYPHNSFLPPGRIQFQWIPFKDIEDIRIVIKSPMPAYKYSFSVSSGTTKAELPDDAPPLNPNIRYYWKIKAVSKTDMEPFSSPLCWFGVLSDDKYKEVQDEMEKIDSMAELDSDTRNILKANVLISYGLYHTAVDILSQALSASPQVHGIKEVLRGVYIKMRLIEEAERLR